MRSLMLALLGLLVLVPPAESAPVPPRIVMMWQVTGPNYANDFRELKQMGVNVAQTFALAKEDAAYVDGYLKAAADNGIGVVPFIGTFIEGQDAGCSLSPAGADFVKAHAGAPALMAWHTIDEPTNHQWTKACQKRVYDQVKALDASHPVLVSINFTKQQEYDGYFDERAFDILDLHKYPNPDIGPAQQRLLSTFKQNRTRKYRVIVTLRAFDAPQKVRRLEMHQGTLFQQYSYFFGADKVGDDIGFYGWRLAPNLGVSQIDWLKVEFLNLNHEKGLTLAPAR